MSSPKIKRFRLVRCSTANITSFGELDDGEGRASMEDYAKLYAILLCLMLCVENAMDVYLFIGQVHS